jgi:hypothetical protein
MGGVDVGGVDEEGVDDGGVDDVDMGVSSAMRVRST